MTFLRIRTKIILVFSIAILVITSAGFLSFQSLLKLTSTIEIISRPNSKLEKIQNILSDISSAESGVRAYSLSRNINYLGPYFHFLSTVEHKMDTLKSFYISNSLQLNQINTLDSLIGEKFIVFSEFIDLKNNKNIVVTLSDIATKLEESYLAPAEQVSEAKEKYFFNRIKNLVKNKEEEIKKEKTRISDVRKANRQSVTEILTQAELKNKQHLAVLSMQELYLLQKDEEIMVGIKNIVEQIRKDENSASILKISESQITAQKSFNTILVIGLFSMIIILGFVYFIFSDISKSTRYKNELEKSKKETEKLSKLKEEFLANMSHEIRTPLNAIIGFTDQLVKTKMDTEQEKFICAVQKSSDHLLNVVNEILDLSKIESGKLNIDSKGFNVREIIGEVVDTMKNSAEIKNLNLNFSVEKSLHKEILIGDPFRIKQILLNLVSNAIKFTATGNITINCTEKNRINNQLILNIAVIDTGIGISNENIKKIFDEFSQADISITSAYGGTGLGLAISKKLAELQNGSLRVKSLVNKGSTFTFSVPCKVGEQREFIPANTDNAGHALSGLSKKSVLIIDDDEMNRLLLSTILNRYNFEITEASDGHDALNLIQLNNYDLIISDINLPGISGVDLTRQIRMMPDKMKTKTPIIAFTANVNKEDIDNYLKAGMNDYILKPFTEEALCQKIIDVLANKTS